MRNGQAYQQKTEKFSDSEEKKFGRIDSRSIMKYLSFSGWLFSRGLRAHDCSVVVHDVQDKDEVPASFGGEAQTRGRRLLVPHRIQSRGTTGFRFFSLPSVLNSLNICKTIFCSPLIFSWGPRWTRRMTADCCLSTWPCQQSKKSWPTPYSSTKPMSTWQIRLDSLCCIWLWQEVSNSDWDFILNTIKSS